MVGINIRSYYVATTQSTNHRDTEAFYSKVCTALIMAAASPTNVSSPSEVELQALAQTLAALRPDSASKS